MDRNNYIAMDTCKQIRGIMAVIIMLHHISFMVDFGVALNFIFRQVGATATTIFFFYSGYGMMLGLMNNPHYLKGFFKKRMVTVLVPFLIAGFAYGLFLLFAGRGAEVLKRLGKLLHGGTFLPYAWFVFTLLSLYCIFYLSFKWLSDFRKGILVCSALTLILALLLCYLQFEQFWYTSSFAFVFGLLFAYNFESFDGFLKSYKIPKATVTVILFLALTIFGKGISNAYIVLVLKNFRAILACIIILYGSMLIKRKNKLLLFLGMISYEFYLYHGVMMDVFSPMAGNVLWFTVLVAFTNTIISFLFNMIDTKIILCIKKNG